MGFGALLGMFTILQILINFLLTVYVWSLLQEAGKEEWLFKVTTPLIGLSFGIVTMLIAKLV